MKRKKIVILYTGGTIGMVKTGDGYAPKTGYFEDVLNHIQELKNEEMPEIQLVEFERLLDSSNITVQDWTTIARTIEKYYDSCDGFVVLHGTDTMAYTSSALSFMLEGLCKPVVITGAQIPIGETRSDGRENLITSVMIAGQGICNEVCLYFGGKLLRGNRATKVSADELEAFDSPNFPYLATAAIDIRYNEKYLRHDAGPLQVTQPAAELPIAVLKVFPGIQLELFEGIMTDKLKGLVLEGFGVGNVPQYDNSLIPIIRKAAENGTIITVCTQCLRGAVRLGAYQTSSALKAAGALSGYDMTAEAAVTKLYYLFGKGYSMNTIRALMETDLRGELTKY